MKHSGARRGREESRGGAIGWHARCAGLLLVVWHGAGFGQGLIRDTEIENILREYANPIFESAGLRPDDVRLTILDDPSVNAFVAGGQNIYFHTGLLTAAETPDELKGVIAHETGHISGGHTVSRQQALNTAMQVNLLTLGLGVLAFAAGTPQAGIALALGSQSLAARTFFSFTRAEESAADQAALSFLEATGQSADGLISFLTRIRRAEVLAARRPSPYTRTHPVGSDRISALRSRAGQIADQAGAQEQRSIDQLAMMKAKIIGFLWPPQDVVRTYPESDSSAAARYARAIAFYRDVRIDEATELIDGLIVQRPDTPYFHELKGQMLFENGRASESVAHHRAALRHGPVSALLMINLGRSLLAVGQSDGVAEALTLLQRAVVLEPDNTFAWGELGRGYGAQGKDGRALLAFAEQAFVTGQNERASQFAQRALAFLSQDGPSRRRAIDILLSTGGPAPVSADRAGNILTRFSP